VGIFGRVRPEKGTDVFVDAMLDVLPKFPEFTAVIVGLCQQQYYEFKKDLERRIVVNGLSDRIFFIGEVPPAEIRDWYASVLITVACPIYEGYGLTVLEGIACGCAAIATDTGVFREVIERSGAGETIPVNSTKRLIMALAKMLEEPEKTSNLGNCARSYIYKRYSAESEANAIKTVYFTFDKAQSLGK
jgi:mannosyltransferase